MRVCGKWDGIYSDSGRGCVDDEDDDKDEVREDAVEAEKGSEGMAYLGG